MIKWILITIGLLLALQPLQKLPDALLTRAKKFPMFRRYVSPGARMQPDEDLQKRNEEEFRILNEEHQLQLERLKEDERGPLEKKKMEKPQEFRKKFFNGFIPFINREDLMKDITHVRVLGKGGNARADLVLYKRTLCVLKTFFRGRIDEEEVKIMLHLDGAGGAPRILAVTEREFLCTYAGNKTLYELIHDESQDQEFLLGGIAQISECVREIHAKGVIHNDIKEDNVVYDTFSKRFSVIDFGLGTYTGEVLWKDGTAIDSKKFQWMAPEIKRGGKSTPKSDIYSLGVLLGNVIFEFETPNAVAQPLVGRAISERVEDRPSLEEFIVVMKMTQRSRYYERKARDFFGIR
ncbi:uncharacterized protein [Palaemon carinicauda]|uniref:uncharacterized protein n=1 Tax=Palaemon carinicauda TaxID=392227 RepID=UPI0035B5B3DF